MVNEISGDQLKGALEEADLRLLFYMHNATVESCVLKNELIYHQWCFKLFDIWVQDGLRNVGDMFVLD